ncbi:hypothetical protein EHS13_15305 [Paenibacillus psychroresistens]|uniref:Uncharacterized protein n=1 Tax=Paenibacillus psychroresistens TaxID=1778678 RepID=A0A6B8RK67_9BACL|nr:hypothetical protein [Paenibacillus psychroresistens]QGQ96144.1 hypothetical protein EHS13_15305 [Paenibacillus psychroresistens]
MELKSEVRIALENINFYERNRALAKKYDFDLKKTMRRYDNLEVIRIFNDLGYSAEYDNIEDGFLIVEKDTLLKFQFSFDLKYSIVNLIWAIWVEK